MKKILLISLILTQSLSAQLCSKWSEHQEIGKLNEKFINEASGLIVSDFPNRLYHINDSGDGPYFYLTDLNGQNTKKIEIENFKPKDVESMAYGECENKKCLVIADIGDNAEERKSISFVIIEEEKSFSNKVKPLSIIKAKYPDTSHNVEGVAMHPNGNIYIVTKAVDYNNNRAAPAKVYVLEKDQWQNNNGKTKELVNIGTIDLPFHLYNYNLWGRIVTGFDIHPSGSKILLSTYKVAVEISIDISKDLGNTRLFSTKKNMSIIPLNPYLQIESVSYLDHDSFIYTTEFHDVHGSPLVKTSCEQ